MNYRLHAIEDSEQDRSSVDNVYDQILAKIIDGSLATGEAITSTQLARELKVSRTPVVSAIDRLASDGLLFKEKNRRARVREGAEKWLLQIHELREIAEPPAAALAAQKMPTQALDQLEQLADAAAPSNDPAWELAAQDFDFALHLAIADHCGNLPLRKTIYRCWKFKRLSYQLGCSNREVEEIGYREHLSILAALMLRDSATASAAMLFHLRSSLLYTKVRQVV
jgi:DNA-binding GntR family transcriptional regulator